MSDKTKGYEPKTKVEIYNLISYCVKANWPDGGKAIDRQNLSKELLELFNGINAEQQKELAEARELLKSAYNDMDSVQCVIWDNHKKEVVTLTESMDKIQSFLTPTHNIHQRS